MPSFSNSRATIKFTVNIPIYTYLAFTNSTFRRVCKVYIACLHSTLRYITDLMQVSDKVCTVQSTKRTACRYLLFCALFDDGEVAYPDDFSDLILDSQLCRFVMEVAERSSYEDGHKATVHDAETPHTCIRILADTSYIQRPCPIQFDPHIDFSADV